MTMTIIDESGVYTVDEDEDENIMCRECYATNEPYRKRCRNCGCSLTKKVKEIVR